MRKSRVGTLAAPAIIAAVVLAMSGVGAVAGQGLTASTKNLTNTKITPNGSASSVRQSPQFRNKAKIPDPIA
jgi:hypothetical protein